MNNDLISRKWLTDAIRNRRTYLSYEDAKDVIDLIDNAPIVEPCKDCEDRRQAKYIRHGSSWHELQALRKFKEEHERPQGEWITRHKLNSFGQDVVCFECNKCGEYKVPLYHLLITEPLKVCPNCGANMRKGGAE